MRADRMIHITRLMKVVFWLLTPCSVLFSSDVSEEHTASELREKKIIRVDAKVIGLCLTGNFNGIRQITEMDGK